MRVRPISILSRPIASIFASIFFSHISVCLPEYGAIFGFLRVWIRDLFCHISPDFPRVPDQMVRYNKRMNSSSSDPPLLPCHMKRQKSVTSLQLIAESQSLLSPVAHDASTGTPLTSAAEVNVESQLTHGTDFPSDSSFKVKGGGGTRFLCSKLRGVV